MNDGISGYENAPPSQVERYDKGMKILVKKPTNAQALSQGQG